MNSPWLCNLDWTVKKFRGKQNSKELKQLIASLEEKYQVKETNDMGKEEEEEEEEEGKYKFLITSWVDDPKRKDIHMPNYPESVMKLDGCFCVSMFAFIHCHCFSLFFFVLILSLSV